MDCYRNHSDDDLVCLLQEGNEAAFDEIYNRYCKTLINEAHKRLGNLEFAEEIVQDVFIDLWTNRERRKIESLLPYLLVAVRYQVFHFYRKQKNLPYFEEPLEHIGQSDNNLDASFFLKELIAVINSWLGAQPEKRREIFRLKYLEQLSTKEIADELSISQKTVQNQLIIGQDSLRNAVSKLLTISLLLFR